VEVVVPKARFFWDSKKWGMILKFIPFVGFSPKKLYKNMDKVGNCKNAFCLCDSLVAWERSKSI
jgi:hypothetical protein